MGAFRRGNPRERIVRFASTWFRRVQLPWQDQLALLRYTFRSFLRSPGNFLLPPLNQAQNPDLG
jgi:hypothetical protein